MRSPTDAPSARPSRVRLERLARLIAVVALSGAWWVTGRVSSSGRALPSDASDARDADALAQVVADPQRASLHVNLRDVPNATVRATLHAAALAGVVVSWSAKASLSPMVLSVLPLADPMGGRVVRVAAPDGTPLALSDSLGWLDSTVTARGGVTWPLGGNARNVSVSSPTASARAQAPVLAPLKRIRMFAAPGWEARFAMRALEDAGWSVDAAFSIAPRVNLTAGAPATIDTARYAAVIALDSSAWTSASAIAAFVRSGGGLVLFPDAARGSALSAVRIGVPGGPLAGVPGAFALDAPREGLRMRPILSARSDAVILERSTRPGTPVAMAAFRLGSGRVVQVGWENSWEWRMLGGENAVAEHRDWWRGLLHRTAHVSVAAPVAALPLPGERAPYADLVARLGAPVEEPPAGIAADRTPSPPPPWLFAVAALALLAEWWSRRLRGAR